MNEIKLKANEHGTFREQRQKYIKFVVMENFFAKLGKKFFCLGCDAEINHISETQNAHILAKAEGGSKTWKNMILLCCACNNRQGKTHANEFFSGSRFANIVKLASIEATQDEWTKGHNLAATVQYDTNAKMEAVESNRHKEVELF